MIIVKLRKPYIVQLYWVPITEWLWESVVSIPEIYSPPTEYTTLGYTFDEYNIIDVEIGNVIVDNIPYTQTASISASQLIEKSWYFDITGQRLYVHPDHTKRLDSSEFDTLQVNGYSDHGVFYDINNTLFEPFLNSSIRIRDNVDRLRFQKLSLTTNTLTFDNTTGEFDFAFVTPVPGADVNILYISDEDVKEGKKDLTPIYTGYTSGQTITSDTYTISLEDKRGQLNGKFPENVFSASDFANIEDKFIDDIIPEGYGDNIGIPAICTNGKLTSGDVTYKYAESGTALDTVYVQIDDVWTEKTPTAFDADECTFTLSASDGRESSGRYRKAKVDATLREETNPADILQDMIFRYTGFDFNSDYFNLGEWASEKEYLSDVAYFIDKKEEFFKLIQPLQNGSNYNFIFRVDAEGKFTIKVDDIERAASGAYMSIDNFSDKRQVKTDFVQYATAVNIQYSKDIELDKYQVETVDTFKQVTLDTYRLEQELDFETLLTSQADAIEKGGIILKDYKKARDEHTITVKGIIPQSLLDVYIHDSSIYIDNEVIRDYAGEVKLKISSYDLDFDNNLTTLTGYDISDIIGDTPDGYTQGAMFGTDTHGVLWFQGSTGGEI